MKTIKLVFAALLLLIQFISVSQETIPKESNNNFVPREITVLASLRHISDIDFVKREYKMELWLKFVVRNADKCALTDLESQIAIKEAKITEIDTVPNWQASIKSCASDPKPDTTKTLRIRCTMIQNWDVAGYPFDKQNLNITIYNSQRSSKYFEFDPKEVTLHYANPLAMKEDSSVIEIENGWTFKKDLARVVSLDTLVKDPFQGRYSKSNQPKYYSSIHYTIPIQREHQGFLFLKLLVGMYVAFFVAFIALFIKMEYTEVRFSLPVGGLFAAIANKYIMESILPQSPDFTMVDWLHSITIIYILLIIAYSAWDLYSFKKDRGRKMTRFTLSDTKVNILFLMTYFLITLVLIIGGTNYYI